jgi:hypothetical protein
MSIIYYLIMGDQGSFLSNPTLYDTAWKWSQSMAKKSYRLTVRIAALKSCNP